MTTDQDIHDAMQEAYDLASGEASPSRQQGLFEMIGDSFRGRQRWMSLLVFFYILLFTVAWVASAIMFFSTDKGDTRGLILWAAAFVVSGNIVMMCKLWYWNMMNRNALAREIKRLEVRIAELQASGGNSAAKAACYT
jgi:uncharacterized SAM-binding protein YcdF (DUF218 family)